MPLLPTDDQGRYRGLPAGPDPEWVASDSPRLLAENELENLVARANSGDPEATQKLREFFGEKCGGGTFRRVLFRAVAKSLGAGATWDHWNAESDFERLNEGLKPQGGSFTDNLLAEATAFAHCINQVTHKRALDLDFETRDSSSPDSERAVRQRCLNASAATLGFVRTCRLLQSVPLRKEKAAHLEQQRELTSLRIQLLQEQLRQLKAKEREAQRERGASAPHPGPRSFRSDNHDKAPNPREVIANPAAHGVESVELFLASLKEEKREELRQDLTKEDSTRGDWANPSAFNHNRYPTLFPQSRESPVENRAS